MNFIEASDHPITEKGLNDVEYGKNSSKLNGTWTERPKNISDVFTNETHSMF